MALTTAIPDRADEKPQYLPYLVEVARTQRLGPSFIRITFSGQCLRNFGAAGDDQRVKLLLPQPGRTADDIPCGADWYASWQAMSNEVRPVMRTYTVRSYRPESAELDVDFVLHGLEQGHSGPASQWAAETRPGALIGLVGPDRPGAGRMWGCEWSLPETARSVLLAGDETAVPAMGSIAESLPAGVRAIVCLEVPTASDIQPWQVHEGITLRWSVRGTEPVGSKLEGSVREALHELRGSGSVTTGLEAELNDVDVDTSLLWEVPESHRPAEHSGEELRGWLAGEAAVIKRVRRLLVNDFGVPRAAVAFMGYWREGRS